MTDYAHVVSNVYHYFRKTRTLKWAIVETTVATGLPLERVCEALSFACGDYIKQAYETRLKEAP